MYARCRPRSQNPACVRNPCRVCTVRGRRRRAGKLSTRRPWRASDSSGARPARTAPVSYTHLRAHETSAHL
eukprot:10271425-Alexandrium_andersonii.AAC.1